MSQENVEIERRWWEGFNEDGMPPLSLYDDEIEINNPPDFPVRGSFQGHDGVRHWRWTVRDGKLLKAQGYLNRADALEAAGLSE